MVKNFWSWPWRKQTLVPMRDVLPLLVILQRASFRSKHCNRMHCRPITLSWQKAKPVFITFQQPKPQGFVGLSISQTLGSSTLWHSRWHQADRLRHLLRGGSRPCQAAHLCRDPLLDGPWGHPMRREPVPRVWRQVTFHSYLNKLKSGRHSSEVAFALLT